MKLYIDNDVVAHQIETPKQMAEVFQRIDDDQPVFVSLEDAGSELCLNPNDVAELARAFLAQERVVEAAAHLNDGWPDLEPVLSASCGPELYTMFGSAFERLRKALTAHDSEKN